MANFARERVCHAPAACADPADPSPAHPDLNLMPTKIVTETQLARLLANSPLQVQLTFLQTKTHDTTHTPQEHMKAFINL